MLYSWYKWVFQFKVAPQDNHLLCFALKCYDLDAVFVFVFTPFPPSLLRVISNDQVVFLFYLS